MQITRAAWSPDLLTVLKGNLPRAGGRVSSHNDAVVRSLRGAGFGAVLGLPLLLLASLVLEAPMAGPAVIASGYLGIASATASEKPAQAALISAIVFCGLVTWSVLMVWGGEAMFSWPGLAAALLAPFFAASPLLARVAISVRDGVTPAGAEAGMLPVETSPIADQPAEPCPTEEVETGDVGARAAEAPTLDCDIEAAARFALRHAQPKAEARAISLVVETVADVLVACDRQTCRRILCALLDYMVASADAGGSVSLSARRVRGVALLRLQCCGESGGDVPNGESLATVRMVIEAAGGTLVAASLPQGFSLSVRLDLAGPRMAIKPESGRTEVH